MPLPRLARRIAVLAGTTALVGAALPALAQDGDAVELAPVLVQAELAYSGAIDGYLAPASDTGFKAGVPVSEQPQSLSVVTSHELAVRQPQKVDEAVRYVVGVNSGEWGNDPRYDQFSMRGFDMGTSALYRDGLPQKSLGMSGFAIDPYMLERVDVLRGPAGVLYGANEAGGMVNMITKRPVFERLVDTQISYGSYGTVETGFDISDTLDSNGTLAGRLTGLYRNGGTALHDAPNDRSLIAGGLTWAPTDDTSVTFLGHLQYDNLPQLVTVPVAGEDYDASLGALPEDFYKSHSRYDRFAAQRRSFGWDATHRLTDTITVNQKFRYSYDRTLSRQLDLYAPKTDGIAPGVGVVYYAYDIRSRAESYGLDNNVEIRGTLFGGENSLVVGFDMQRSWNASTQYTDYEPYVLSYTDPSYDFDVAQPALYDVSRETYDEDGLYMQDHLRLDNGVTLTAGLRHSWLKSTSTSYYNDTYDSQKDQATTGLFGLTWDTGTGYVPYLSYTEGFTQNVGTTIDGKALDPSKSRQWEAGVRYTPESLPLSVSAAVFDLRKTNVKDYDRDDPSYETFTQAGEVRSRGVELELRGQVAPTLQGVVNYAWLNSTVTKAVDETLIGNRSAFSPRNQVSFWLDYDAAALLPGLGFGAGARYVSAAYAAQDNVRRTPSYTLADLAAHYEADDYRVSLNVSNLFNRAYYGTCMDSYGCIRGEGRIVSLTLGKRF